MEFLDKFQQALEKLQGVNEIIKKNSSDRQKFSDYIITKLK